MMEKFYSRKRGVRQSGLSITYLVFIDRIDAQLVKRVLARLDALLPLGHLRRTQVVWRIHVAGLPPPRHLLLKIGRPAKLGHFGRSFGQLRPPRPFLGTELGH